MEGCDTFINDDEDVHHNVVGRESVDLVVDVDDTECKVLVIEELRVLLNSTL